MEHRTTVFSPFLPSFIQQQKRKRAGHVETTAAAARGSCVRIFILYTCSREKSSRRLCARAGARAKVAIDLSQPAFSSFSDIIVRERERAATRDFYAVISIFFEDARLYKYTVYESVETLTCVLSRAFRPYHRP